MLDNLADGISVEGMESLIPHWSANPRRRRPTTPPDGADWRRRLTETTDGYRTIWARSGVNLPCDTARGWCRSARGWCCARPDLASSPARYS